MKKIFAALTFGLLILSSYASSKATELSLEKSSPTEVLESIEKLQSRADKLPVSEKKQFLADAAALNKRISALTSFENLQANERVEIVNAYEALRVRADGTADSERRICERVKRLGSNMTTTICLTKAERDRSREVAADGMATMQRNGVGATTKPSQ